jgi:hypothetical protein
LRKKFQALLKQLYEDVVVMDFKEKARKYKVNEEMAAKFVSSVKREE